uniref:Uncharacterized protein n=1 Tax=Salix viminalis TaxID=40686 RepID=A0A6N2KST8_SALVM
MESSQPNNSAKFKSQNFSRANGESSENVKLKHKSCCLFPSPLPIFKSNNIKDNTLVEYKEKHVMACIDRKKDCVEVLIIKDNKR